MDGDDAVRGAQWAFAEAEAALEKFGATRVCVAAREAEAVAIRRRWCTRGARLRGVGRCAKFARARFP